MSAGPTILLMLRERRREGKRWKRGGAVVGWRPRSSPGFPNAQDAPDLTRGGGAKWRFVEPSFCIASSGTQGGLPWNNWFWWRTGTGWWWWKKQKKIRSGKEEDCWPRGAESLIRWVFFVICGDRPLWFWSGKESERVRFAYRMYAVQ